MGKGAFERRSGTIFIQLKMSSICWQLMRIIPHRKRWNNKSVHWKFLCLTLNIAALARSVFTVNAALRQCLQQTYFGILRQN